MWDLQCLKQQYTQSLVMFHVGYKCFYTDSGILVSCLHRRIMRCCLRCVHTASHGSDSSAVLAASCRPEALQCFVH